MVQYCYSRSSSKFLLFLAFLATVVRDGPALASVLQFPLGTTWKNTGGTLPSVMGEYNGTYRVVDSAGRLDFTFGFVATLPPDYSNFTFSVFALQNYTSQRRGRLRTVVGTASVVWSANRDNLVSDGAVLQLGTDGNLVLYHADGRWAWASNTRRQGVTGMELLPSGNLVLVNSRNDTVWQSFSMPTEALLPGQTLSVGSYLVSSISSSNPSSGKFSLVVESDGVYLYASSPFGGPQPFWGPGSGGRPGVLKFFREMNITGSRRLSQNGSDCFSLSTIAVAYSTTNSLVLQEFWNMSACNIPRAAFDNRTALSLETFASRFPLCAAPVIGCHLKLDSDGEIRQYQPRVTRTEMSWTASPGSDLLSATGNYSGCFHPDVCGPYGVCTDGACSCPHNKSPDVDSFFRYIDPRAPKLGCDLSTPLSTCANSTLSRQQTLLEVDDVTYFAAGSNHFSGHQNSNATLDFCKESCLRNCSCQALFVTSQSSSFPTIASGTNCFYFPQLSYSLRNVSSQRNGSLLFRAFFKVEVPPNGVVLSSPHRPVKKLAGVVASGVFVVLILIFVLALYFCYKKRVRLHRAAKEGMLLAAVPGLPPKLSFKELKAATGNFARQQSYGGLGTVFEGVLSDGTKVAVKQLHRQQHAQKDKDLHTQVATLGSIQHYNLIWLQGFCPHGAHLFLVYELLPYGTLDSWLFSRAHDVQELDETESTQEQRVIMQPNIVPVLPWNVRFNISLGIARGLLHLHEGCAQPVLHLEIRPQNILLDSEFTPKISGFGISELEFEQERQGGARKRRESEGYQAPEWLLHAPPSAEMDVYSYGMVILEIISGRRNLDISDESDKAFFPSWASEQVELGRQIELVDSRLEGSFDREQAEKLVHIALWCIQEVPNLRPRMRFVVEMLEGQEKIPKAPLSLHVALQNPGGLFEELGGGFSVEKLGMANFDQNSEAYNYELELSDVELLMSRERSDD